MTAGLATQTGSLLRAAGLGDSGREGAEEEGVGGRELTLRALGVREAAGRLEPLGRWASPRSGLPAGLCGPQGRGSGQGRVQGQPAEEWGAECGAIPADPAVSEPAPPPSPRRDRWRQSGRGRRAGGSEGCGGARPLTQDQQHVAGARPVRAAQPQGEQQRPAHRPGAAHGGGTRSLSQLLSWSLIT